MTVIHSRRLKRTYPHYSLTAYEHSMKRSDGVTSLYWYSYYVDKRTTDPLCPSIFVDIIKQTEVNVSVEPFMLDFLNVSELPKGIEYYEAAATTAKQIEQDIQRWKTRV